MRISQLALTIAATWFYSGKFPKAPGTMGSLAALPLGWILALYGTPWLFGAAAILFLIGLYVSHHYSKMIGQHDAGEIVIDEVVGQWLCLLPLPLIGEISDLGWLLAGFVLFRIFDILKPWPIGWVDRRVSGGMGIMLDDVLAGLFGMGVLIVARLLIGGF
ncbi:phosphatidylglycerophosphatase A [Thalassospira sp.]|uniref:phosphatidylglycerophosphatase A family protein n=1 Tax=Thalassospira sp. TaxID=1912094 RepID=UPI00273496CE|nr:phosphatidylglycerophosphatase A [Thalassospira sp.]MDP2697814.1 phosphatidylglycerophosphatase A [Thalassospira sp.]